MVNQRAYGEDRMQLLGTSYRHARESLRPFRQNRYSAMAKFAGHLYGTAEKNAKRAHVNWIELIVTTLMSRLVPAEPKALVRTFNMEYEALAYDFGLVINKTLDRIGYREHRELATLDSLLGPMGILKLGVTDGGTYYGSDGSENESNIPFIDSVDFGDFACDWEARAWDECDWFACRYVAPYDEVMENKDYNRIARQELAAAMDPPTHEDQGDRRTRELGDWQYNSPGTRSYRKRVELLEVYLPYDGGDKGVIMTVGLMNHQVMTRPLQVKEYEGPDHPYGPYRFLWYHRMPNNLMPVPPVSHWTEMHDLINSVYRKQNDFARAMKLVGVVTMGSEDDAAKLVNAKNLEVHAVDGDSVNWMKIGGPAPELFLLNDNLGKDLNMVAGNIQSLAGLAPQSDTASQDAMLSRSANMRLNAMMEKSLRTDREVMVGLGDLIWIEPTFRMALTKRVPGVDMDIPVIFDSEIREGVDYLDLDIDIDPYSQQTLQPGERNQVLTQTAEFLTMAAQALAEQGKRVDFEEVLRQRARYLNMPELMKLLQPAEQLPEYASDSPKGPSHERSMPTSTKRTYERVGRPGNSGEQPEQTMAARLMANAMTENNGSNGAG